MPTEVVIVKTKWQKAKTAGKVGAVVGVGVLIWWLLHKKLKSSGGGKSSSELSWVIVTVDQYSTIRVNDKVATVEQAVEASMLSKKMEIHISGLATYGTYEQLLNTAVAAGVTVVTKSLAGDVL